MLETMRGNYGYFTHWYWGLRYIKNTEEVFLSPRIYVLQHPRYNKYTVDLKRAASKDSISKGGSYYFHMNSDLQPTREREQTDIEI